MFGRCWRGKLLIAALVIGPVAQRRTAQGPLTWRSCEGAHPRFSGTPALLSGAWYVIRADESQDSWEFWGDSMFRHIRVTRRSRISERGRFALRGGRMLLHITSKSSTVLGDGIEPPLDSGTVCTDQTRSWTLIVLGRDGADGLVLNGVHLHLLSR